MDKEYLLSFQLQMAIVKTMDTFPLSCICVVMYDFHAALKEKKSCGNQSTLWHSTPDLSFFSYFQIMFIVFL